VTLSRDRKGISHDVMTLSRDMYGNFATYTCKVGSMFTEGAPGCYGNQVTTLVRVY